jgi:hypothetical protein
MAFQRIVWSFLRVPFDFLAARIEAADIPGCFPCALRCAQEEKVWK